MPQVYWYKSIDIFCLMIKVLLNLSAKGEREEKQKELFKIVFKGK